MNISRFEKEVIQLVIDNPFDFKSKFKQLGNVKHANAVMNKFFGFRLGFEIESPGREDRYDIYNWGDLSTFLKKVFNDSSRYFMAAEEGYGIHIHVDAYKIKSKGLFKPWNFPTSLLELLIKIFNYKGSFNSHTVSYFKTAIKYHEYLTTIEYRILPVMLSTTEYIKAILTVSLCNRYLLIGNEKQFSLQNLKSLISRVTKL